MADRDIEYAMKEIEEHLATTRKAYHALPMRCASDCRCPRGDLDCGGCHPSTPEQEAALAAERAAKK